MTRAFVVLASLILTPLLASAQRTPPGARIRLAGSPRDGVLLEWREDGALIRTRGSSESVLIPTDQLGHFEVFAGTRSNVVGGAMIGAGVGFLGGVTMGLAMSSDDYFDIDTGDVLALGAASAVTGAGLGALVGLAWKKPVWAPIQTGAFQVRAALEPRRVGLSFRVRF